MPVPRRTKPVVPENTASPPGDRRAPVVEEWDLAVLELALSRLVAPAYILGPGGTVLRSNEAATRAPHVDGPRLAELVEDPRRAEKAGFRVIALPRGDRSMWLVHHDTGAPGAAPSSRTRRSA
jgi:hypothetical protein